MQKIMGQSSANSVSAEEIDKVAVYLKATEAISFRSACKNATLQEFHNLTRRFFSTWRTSLVGSDLSTLEALSRNVELRSCVKGIHIEDDCDRSDPWNTHEPLQSENLWPRDDSGMVLSDQIGVASFRAMLTDGRLFPETIRIRDYRIDDSNLILCPSVIRTQDYRIATRALQAPAVEAAAALTRAIVDGIDVAIVSLCMQTLQPESSRGPTLPSLSLPGGGCPRQPEVSEVVVYLSPAHQGHNAGFSLLRSAQLLVVPFWLEQVLNRALNLKSLEISVAKLWDTTFTAGTLYPQLQKLSIQSSQLHSRTVLAVLKNSKHSLTSVSFSMVTLIEDSTWTELLSSIGEGFPHLTHFRIRFVRQGNPSSNDVVTFLGFGNDESIEQYRSGLELDERGPPQDRRLTRISYHGPDAGTVLKQMAIYAALKRRRQ